MLHLLSSLSILLISFQALSFSKYWELDSYEIINHSSQKKKKLNQKEKPKTQLHFNNIIFEDFANVESPTCHEKPLQALDIDPDLDNNRLLAGYNFSGESKKGSLQLIQLEPEISILSEIIFFKSDINSIYLNKSKVYFSGSDQSGAFYSYATITEDGFERISPKIYLPGYVATDIFVYSSKVFVTTGGNSGVHFFEDSNTTPTWSYDIPHARSVLYYPWSRKVKVLSGQPAKTFTFNYQGDLLSTLEIGGSNTAESKSTLTTSPKYNYATVGEEGLRILCNNTVVKEIPSVKIDGIPPKLTVTNSSSSYNNFILTANGKAGVYIYKQSEESEEDPYCSSPIIEELGHFHLEPGTSANHVVAEEGYVFVASGRGGVRVLKILEENNHTD